MFFMKCTVGFLVLGLSDGDWSPWSHWLPYVVACFGILTAVGNVPIMATALQEYEAVFMVTLFAGCNIAVACISADVVLQELASQSLHQRLLYWFSVSIIAAGLCVIQSTTVEGIATARGPDSSSDEEVPILEVPKPGRGLSRRGSLRSLDELQSTPSSSSLRRARGMSVIWLHPLTGAGVYKLPQKLQRSMSMDETPSRTERLLGDKELDSIRSRQPQTTRGLTEQAKCFVRD
eukprot:TRINITY_DN47946_c0_g1_i1.p1 TRINITY_DN47946_c0_g1~~TRINITY_DN47946_c0_g1_i1.p1  ORF type:complete len:252 (+),score=33.45 TRINITY_DN47946_c0_g1_i1:55-756(+)